MGWSRFFRRARWDEERAKELESHLAHEHDLNIARGLSADEARRAAYLKLGSPTRIREDIYAMNTIPILDTLWRDLRYGVRTLRKRLGFSAVAVASLAIGIGANTAIFSAVNAIILRDLPYERPEELVDVHLQLPDLLFPVLSYPDFEDFRDSTRDAFVGALGTQFVQVSVAREGGDATELGEAVTGNYFSLLGIDAMLGRVIGPDDDRTRGAHPVVMLSYGYWQRAFGSDPDVVGQELRLEDRAYTIIGVGPAHYGGIIRSVSPAFYAPMMMLGELNGGDLLDARDNHNMVTKARLAPGVTLVQAETVVAAVSANLSETQPAGWDPAGAFSLVRTSDVLFAPQLDGAVRTTAWLLTVVVGLVLLLACVNLAGFLLARALDRQREVALRLALGASRGALVRQILTETTLLGLLGGAFGLGLAVGLLRLASTVDMGLPLTLTLDVAPDATVLAFTLGISLLAGTLLGLVPALQSTRPDVSTTLKSDTAGGGQPGRLRWRNALVVTQLAVSLVLLVGAGLLVRSFQQRQAIDPGFGVASTAILPVMMAPDRFSPAEGRRYVDRLLTRFRALPGVDAVGLINTLPLGGGLQWIDFAVAGHEPPDGQEAFHADRAMVDPAFFDAAGIPLLEGRSFVEADREDGPRVVIISAAMARRFWPGGEAVGQRFRLTGGSPALPGAVDGDLEVVGVAGDIDWEALSEAPRLMVYVPYAQYYSPFVNVFARTSADAEPTALALRTAGREIDAELRVVGDTLTMAQHLSGELRAAQVVTVLLSAFAFLALLLATVGLYGVVSYAVATRTGEVGIRIALGADASSIRRLLTAGGVRLVVVGGSIGIAVSLLAARSLSSLLFGIEVLDPIAFVGASLVLGTAALVAAYLPARRASRVDPVTALRGD